MNFLFCLLLFVPFTWAIEPPTSSSEKIDSSPTRLLQNLRRLTMPAAISPSITTLTNGEIIMAYYVPTNGRIFARGLHANFTPAGAEFQVSYPGQITSAPVIISLADGTFSILWYGYGYGSRLLQADEDSTFLHQEKDKKYDNFDSNSNKILFGHNFQPNTFSIKGPNPARSKGTPRVLTSENGNEGIKSKFYAQRYNADHSLNSDGKPSKPFIYNGGVMSQLTDGGYVSTWQFPYFCSIQAQRFYYDSSPNGPEFEITVGFGYPQVAPLGDGGYVITWGQWGNVCARRFKADDSLFCEEFVVNDSTYSDDSKIIATHDGGYMIMWIDHEEHDLCFVKYQPDNSNKGVLCPINTAYAIKGAAMTSLDDGSILIAWFEDSGALFAKRVSQKGETNDNIMQIPLASNPNPKSLVVTGLLQSKGFIVLWDSVGFFDGYMISFQA